MFKAGRFQAVLGTQLVYSHYLRDDKVRIEDWAPALSREAANLLISKKHFSTEDARRWGLLMKQMQADGSVQRMVQRYLPPEDAAGHEVPGVQLAAFLQAVVCVLVFDELELLVRALRKIVFQQAARFDRL
eukprot:gene31930-36049_t